MKNQMKNLSVWIVVADGARTQVFVNNGQGTGLKSALPHALISDNRPSGELATDRPGRAFDSAGPGRHAMQPSTDPQRHQQKTFAKEIAKMLDEQHSKKAFDQLIIVAAPRMLGDLRDALTQQIRQLVIGEVDKDLTKLSVNDLTKHLGKVFKL